MDDLQQRIVEIALQIPGYLGYEAKERRRDMDKHTRLQLAAKYEAEDTHLARIARRRVAFDPYRGAERFGDMALPDVLIALSACERRGNFSTPCGAGYVDPPVNR